MSAVDHAAGQAPARNPRSRGGLTRSVRDSLVVAQRNLIRMLRIPNRVRPSRLGFISLRGRDLNVSGLGARKELAK
ncbi:integral membrane transport protein [Streptomyces sp. NPDC057743]|uniref:integral membrane transport protein n=1 Tax=Streptomyces sp. NPDC057743 TaxID=3346236 RepID=UPI0036B29A35